MLFLCLLGLPPVPGNLLAGNLSTGGLLVVVTGFSVEDGVFSPELVGLLGLSVGTSGLSVGESGFLVYTNL